MSCIALIGSLPPTAKKSVEIAAAFVRAKSSHGVRDRAKKLLMYDLYWSFAGQFIILLVLITAWVFATRKPLGRIAP